jgi:hypothetical protein
MSSQVPASFQSKYQNNVELVLNQQKPMLLDTVTVTDDASADKIKIRDLVGNTQPQEADERHGDTKYSNTPHDGVWLGKPNELYYAELVDNADKLGTSIDLQGEYTMSGAGTVNRSIDRRILEGIYGSIVSGKDGTTVTAFPAGQIVPVTTGGASGAQRMNTAKLRAANKLLMQQFVDMSEPRYMVITAEQNDDLLTEVPLGSSDFKAVFQGRAENGIVMGMLGWTFIPLELANPLLTTIPLAGYSLDGSGYRKTPFWLKSGVRANFWQRLRTSIDTLPGKVLSTQVFAGTTVSATRTQAGKVGVILNSEA